MSVEIRLRPDGERDLEHAATWYERQRPGLGSDFLDEFAPTLQRISEFPELYPMVHRKTRRALTHRFPFGVYYLVEDGMLVVVAVMHGSRSPRQWMHGVE